MLWRQRFAAGFEVYAAIGQYFLRPCAGQSVGIHKVVDKRLSARRESRVHRFFVSSRFSLLRKAVPNRRSSVSIAGFRFVTCNAIKIRIPKFERSRSPFLFRVIYFSFSHSLVPPASVLCRRFLSLAFRSLFHIPESSVGCGRSCPLVVARKRCQGLRSTGLLHAR